MKGKMTVLLGLFSLLAGLLWYVDVLQESNHAARQVQKLVPQVQQIISQQSVAQVSAEEPTTPKVMTEKVVDGIGYVGVLEIPELSLELPIISSWSVEYGKIAPCRYSGSVFQDDLIICAHNYDSHFGKLNQLSVGDTVEFTDMDGNSLYYQVQEFLTLEGTDVEEIREGNWDLTLFTCTAGGKKRYVVRCSKTS